MLLTMVGLIKICHLIQNLLWEKNVRNKEDNCMEVIRLKVRYTVYSFILLGKVPFLASIKNYIWFSAEALVLVQITFAYFHFS